MEMHNPPHPGEMIEEFMGNLTVTALASYLGVTRPALSKVINGRASVSPEMALKLERAFPCTTASMWLSWQNDYDLWQLRHSGKRFSELMKHVKANVSGMVPSGKLHSVILQK